MQLVELAIQQKRKIMDLYAVLNRGAAHAPKAPELSPKTVRAINQARANWKNALLVDKTRAWLDIGEKQAEVLNGMAVVLTGVCFALAHHNGNEDSPDSRIIMGGLSAIEQCAMAGAVMRVSDARAISASADRALEALGYVSDKAMAMACYSLDRVVKKKGGKL